MKNTKATEVYSGLLDPPSIISYLALPNLCQTFLVGTDNVAYSTDNL